MEVTYTNVVEMVYTNVGLEKVEEGAKRVQKASNLSAISMLFTGRIIERVGAGIARSTLDTFMTISRGMGAAGLALNQFSAEWTFLKFEVGRAIGEALAPLLPLLIPLIEGLVSFVQQHPEVTFWSIMGAIAVGATLMTVALVGRFKTWTGDLLGLSKANFSSVTGLLDTLQKGALIGLSIVAADEAFKDIKAENYVSALGDALVMGGFLTALNPEGKRIGGAVALAGIGLKILGDGLSGDAVDMKALLLTAVNAAFAGYLVGGVPGALFAVSAAIVFSFAIPAVTKLQEFFNGKHDAIASYQYGTGSLKDTPPPGFSPNGNGGLQPITPEQRQVIYGSSGIATSAPAAAPIIVQGDLNVTAPSDAKAQSLASDVHSAAQRRTGSNSSIPTGTQRATNKGAQTYQGHGLWTNN